VKPVKDGRRSDILPINPNVAVGVSSCLSPGFLICLATTMMNSESDRLLCDRIPTCLYVMQLDVEQSPSTSCTVDGLQHSNNVFESFLLISLISLLYIGRHLEQSNIFGNIWEAIKVRSE